MQTYIFWNCIPWLYSSIIPKVNLYSKLLYIIAMHVLYFLKVFIVIPDS